LTDANQQPYLRFRADSRQHEDHLFGDGRLEAHVLDSNTYFLDYNPFVIIVAR